MVSITRGSCLLRLNVEGIHRRFDKAQSYASYNGILKVSVISSLNLLRVLPFPLLPADLSVTWPTFWR